MSMFHELMMRKKEETLYPVIKGSLTDTDGVISNFSSSNYLSLNQSIDLSTQKLEIVLDITLTSFSNDGLCILSANNGLSIQLYRQSTQYKLLNLGGNANSGTKQFVLNTNYKVKFVITSTNVDMYVWENNNWVLDVSYTVNYTTISNIVIGDNYTHSGTRVFTGSMNLNNSYIKLGSTKYNLQAVVGYTVIGSPTIVDGVVSGFSGANFLTLPQPTFDTNDFELKTSFVIDAISTTRILATGSTTFSGIHISATGKITGSFYDGVTRIAIESAVVLTVNTQYYVKCFRKGTIIGISVSTDNINWITNTQTISAETSVVITAQFYIGTNGNYLASFFNGSIDLNETYIKIDGKLWFNGQQA